MAGQDDKVVGNAPTLSVAALSLDSPPEYGETQTLVIFLCCYLITVLCFKLWAFSMLVKRGMKNKSMLRIIRASYLENHERMKAFIPKWIEEYRLDRETGFRLEREYNELHKRDEKRTEAICYQVQLTRHY